MCRKIFAVSERCKFMVSNGGHETCPPFFVGKFTGFQSRIVVNGNGEAVFGHIKLGRKLHYGKITQKMVDFTGN